MTRMMLSIVVTSGDIVTCIFICKYLLQQVGGIFILSLFDEHYGSVHVDFALDQFVCLRSVVNGFLVFLVVEHATLNQHVADVDIEPLGNGVQKVFAVDYLLVSLLGSFKFFRFL